MSLTDAALITVAAGGSSDVRPATAAVASAQPARYDISLEALLSVINALSSAGTATQALDKCDPLSIKVAHCMNETNLHHGWAGLVPIHRSTQNQHKTNTRH
jgi:hypothetical protein